MRICHESATVCWWIRRSIIKSWSRCLVAGERRPFWIPVWCFQSIVWKANCNISCCYCWFLSSSISNYLKYWLWSRKESIVNPKRLCMTEKNKNCHSKPIKWLKHRRLTFSHVVPTFSELHIRTSSISYKWCKWSLSYKLSIKQYQQDTIIPKIQRKAQ